jgi:hypothetical protein
LGLKCSDGLPWYSLISGKDLEQGDILENCPVFLPRADLQATDEGTVFFDEELRDMILHLSQAFARFFMRVGLPVDIPPFR